MKKRIPTIERLLKIMDFTAKAIMFLTAALIIVLFVNVIIQAIWG